MGREEETKYCTKCGRECGVKGVSPSNLCLECFKKENEPKGVSYYFKKIWETAFKLFVFIVPCILILEWGHELLHSFGNSIFPNFRRKIGLVMGIGLAFFWIDIWRQAYKNDKGNKK